MRYLYSSILNILILCVCILALVVYIIFHNIAFKNIFFKNMQNSKLKYSFYESGYKARNISAIEFPIQNYMILVLTILYDAEVFFFFIFLLNIGDAILIDFFLIFFYLILFIFGFFCDCVKGLLSWQLN